MDHEGRRNDDWIYLSDAGRMYDRPGPGDWAVRCSGVSAQELSVGRVSLEVDGFEIANFSELVGITTSVDVADSLPVRRGGRRFVVSLGRPLAPSRELVEWHVRILRGEQDFRSLLLVIYGTNGELIATYDVTNAWPSKMEIGALKAGASEVLMETVTLTCEFIQRIV